MCIYGQKITSSFVKKSGNVEYQGFFSWRTASQKQNRKMYWNSLGMFLLNRFSPFEILLECSSETTIHNSKLSRNVSLKLPFTIQNCLRIFLWNYHSPFEIVSDCFSETTIHFSKLSQNDPLKLSFTCWYYIILNE